MISICFLFFFFNDTATTEIYTLSLHDALPIYVIGVNLQGALRGGVTATDLVLTITEMLRRAKVVGKFVEFFGGGVEKLSVPDRATVANMAPEYGATMGFFPVDDATIDYFKGTGRTPG